MLIPENTVSKVDTMPDITTKTARNRLKIRREPHWMRLHKYCHLGFRRGPESWVARYTSRNGSNHKYEYRALDSHHYDGARKEAEAWFTALGSSAGRGVVRGSVRDALNTYITYLREQGRPDTADNAEDPSRAS